MRILFVAEAPSIHTRRWAEYFVSQGADVHIASFRPGKIYGVTVHVLPRFGLGKLGYLFSVVNLKKLFLTIRPDIVHAHHLTSYGYLAARAGLHPLVVTAWGSDVLISAKKSRLLRYFVRYAVLQADIVTTVAEHMNASVVGLGISPEKITAIPFGVDTQFFVPANPATSQHVPLKLVCTRSFASIYDVGTLVRALAKVFIGGRQLEVELVGDGPLRQSLVGLVQELGLSRSVRFCGHVEPKKLAELLAKADIFVSPALSDGNNVSLTEAMACGCFPIATDIPANAQWIKDGQTGYLYPPGNVDRLVEAIDGAMNNPALRQSAKLENRRIVEMQADWRISVKRMEGIYQRLCGNKSIQHES